MGRLRALSQGAMQAREPRDEKPTQDGCCKNPRMLCVKQDAGKVSPKWTCMRRTGPPLALGTDTPDDGLDGLKHGQKVQSQ
jgi:hypothetical protein